MGKEDLTEIVNTYTDMILRIAYQNLRNMADAEDVAQEVFLRMTRQWPEPASEEYLKAWIIRVTVNLCKDRHKSAWFRKTEPLPEDDRLLGFDDDDRSVLRELWLLPEQDRNILYLHYFEGYAAREMAPMLGVGENAVYSRLSRAREKLKAILLEGEYTNA